MSGRKTRPKSSSSDACSSSDVGSSPGGASSPLSSFASDDDSSPLTISGSARVFRNDSSLPINTTPSEDELCGGTLNDSLLRRRAESSYDYTDHVSNSSFRSQQSNFESESDFSSFRSSPGFMPRQLYPLEPLEQMKKDSLTRRNLRYDKCKQQYKHSKHNQEHEPRTFDSKKARELRMKHRSIWKATSQEDRDEILMYYWDKYVIECRICMFAILLLLVVFVIWPMFGAFLNNDAKAASVNNSNRNNILTRFTNAFQIFTGTFTHQSSLLLLTVKAASKSVMRDYKPLKPAVILLTGNNEAVETIDCMATHIANITSQAYSLDNFIEIRNEDLKAYTDYHDVKKYLEEALRSALSSGKVVVVHDLHKIDGRAAMIFHAFCDNENAPYKDSVIIFTVPIDTTDAITDEEQVEDYLNSVWENHLELDSRSPLMTRIANFVAIVKPEPETTLHEHCPL